MVTTKRKRNTNVSPPNGTLSKIESPEHSTELSPEEAILKEAISMKKYLVYIISLLIVVGCGSDDVIDDIIVTKDKLEVSVSRINFQSEKDSQLFSIKANCSWAITCSDSWLTVSPTSGKDNQEITVTVNKNSLASERTATITIKGGNNFQ